MKKTAHLLTLLCLMATVSSVHCQEWSEIQNIIGAYYGEWNDFSYPGLAGNNRIPNTALLGNGDIGLVSGGDTQSKTYYISKGDFWAYKGSPLPIGGITIGKHREDTENMQGTSLALNATATASESHPSFPVSRMVSGQWTAGYEGWVSAVNTNAATNPFWAELDLATAKRFNRIIIRHDAAARPAEVANITSDFSVSVRNSASEAWVKIIDTVGNHDPVSDFLLSDTIEARYIRLEITKGTQETTADSQNNPRARIGQFEIYKSDGGDINPPEPVDASMHEIQEILQPSILTTYNTTSLKANMQAIVVADTNIVLLYIGSTSDQPQQLSATLWAKADNNSCPFSATNNGQTVTVTRRTPSSTAAGAHISEAAMSARLFGADYTVRSGNNGKADIDFTLEPNAAVFLIVGVGGGGRNYNNQNQLITENPVQQAQNLIQQVNTEADIQKLLVAHMLWWANYWKQSYICFDKTDAKLNTLMKYYYGAQYALGCNIRKGKVAPGLYGLWHVTDNPSWNSDYHLNYNFISTFYGVNTSNRPEQALPAVDAIEQYMEQGQKNAASPAQLRLVKADFVNQKITNGDIDAVNGIPDALLYPVGIGPWGMTLDASYHNEALNAAFSAYPLVQYYNYTLDKDFLRNHVYDYLKMCVRFYESWLETEDQNKTLYAGYNEGSWSKNPAVELSVLKCALQNLIRASEILEIDADKRPLWQDILSRLAPQPTAVYQSKTVFTLAQQEFINNNWQDMANPVPGDGNIIPMEAVIPGGQLGYFSSADQLNIAKNTIDVFSARGAWSQINNFPKIFAVAVNTRYPLQTVIDNMAATINSKIKPNLLIEDNVHGIEKAGATQAINNMFLICHEGIIKLFPGWTTSRDAHFVRLRAEGAFLLSAKYDGSTKTVGNITLASEKGGKLKLANPWTNSIAVTDSQGNAVEVNYVYAPQSKEEIIALFDTNEGETYTISATDIPISTIQHAKTAATALLYPNPVKAGQSLKLNAQNCSSIDEYDATGKWLRRIITEKSFTTFNAAAQPGLYLLVLNQEDGTRQMQKMIIERR